jgi:hypothetical protein
MNKEIEALMLHVIRAELASQLRISAIRQIKCYLDTLHHLVTASLFSDYHRFLLSRPSQCSSPDCLFLRSSLCGLWLLMRRLT